MGLHNAYCIIRILLQNMKKIIGFPKPTKKKKVKVNRTKLLNTLDKLVKDFVKRRDEHICQYCGIYCEGSNCHASHVIPVSHGQHLRFEPLNLKVLCYHHHLNWWHKNPTEAGKWYRNKFPDRMKFLDKEKMISKKLTNDELIEQIELYKTL